MRRAEAAPQKDRGDADRDPGEARADDDALGAEIDRLEADERQRQHQRDEGRRAPHPCERAARGPHQRHHTFSTSGRPKSPVGRKMSTRTSTPNTETSLYALEK